MRWVGIVVALGCALPLWFARDWLHGPPFLDDERPLREWRHPWLRCWLQVGAIIGVVSVTSSEGIPTAWWLGLSSVYVVVAGAVLYALRWSCEDRPWTDAVRRWWDRVDREPSRRRYG